MLARAVYPLHGFGGIERHVFHLVTHLMRLGVDVQLVVGQNGAVNTHEQLRIVRQAAELAAAPPGTGELALHTLRYNYTGSVLRPNSILGRQINYPIFAWNEGRLAQRLVQAGAVDLVHTQGLCAWGYASVRRRDPAMQKIPFIANPHGLEEYRTPDWRKRLAYTPFRALYSRGHRAADCVIATDDCTKDDLPRYLGVRTGQVVVLPSAIDVDECLRAVRHETGVALRARFGLQEADPVLLSVGRIERNKGFHVLLQAFKMVQDVLGARWRWVLVGTGKALVSLRMEAEALGLGDHVVFAGQLNDTELHSLYEAVDLFVHPTLYEGSSLVTLEAMIHRLPVVASAVGGIPDKVVPEQTGLLVPPGDAKALAAALRRALERRADWPAWGTAGAMLAQSTFSWPVVARRTKATYESMLTNDRHTAIHA